MSLAQQPATLLWSALLYFAVNFTCFFTVFRQFSCCISYCFLVLLIAVSNRDILHIFEPV